MARMRARIAHNCAAKGAGAPGSIAHKPAESVAPMLAHWMRRPSTVSGEDSAAGEERHGDQVRDIRGRYAYRVRNHGTRSATRVRVGRARRALVPVREGVMQAPGGPEEDPSGGFAHGGWSVKYWDDRLSQEMTEFMGRPFDMLLGRKTYEIFAAYWPRSTAPGADALNSARKHV